MTLPTPYFDRNGCQLYVGDALTVLARLPAASVQTCVTSPPYFGLRSYGTAPQVWDGDPACEHEWQDGTHITAGGGYSAKSTLSGFTSERTKGRTMQESVTRMATMGTCVRCGAWRGELGSEPTPDLFVAHLVAIFAEVSRVLRPDGTLWLNIGDSYNNRAMTRPSSHQGSLGFTNDSIETAWRDHAANGHTRMSITNGGLKEKDLFLIPFRLALALQADGWIVRQTIIWNKPAPMPESVTDRPTTSHEYVFLLSKQPHYFYDALAGAEPAAQPIGVPALTGQHKRGALQSLDSSSLGTNQGAATRNARSVWTINPTPFTTARMDVGNVDHFAAYPPALPARCIRAGTSERGCCPACGAPHERVTERHAAPKSVERLRNVGGRTDGYTRTRASGGLPPVSYDTTGWRPTCRCADPRPPVPCVALDPFAGAGTTLLAAQRLGRRAVGIELNPDYARIIEARVGRQGVLDFAAEEAAG